MMARERNVMGNTLQGTKVLVIGRASGIARAVSLLARTEGAEVVVAGRDAAKLAAAYDDPGITTETVDVSDDASIAALAVRIGTLARGALPDLERANLQQSLDTKVSGPVMLAKYLAPQVKPGGSFVLFSGANASRRKPGTWAWPSPTARSTS
jgi:NAD(P)-dependent dehydrogenase (short-subunit alcohol dehydrogenase family)